MDETRSDREPRPRNARFEQRLTRRAALGAATALGLGCVGRPEEAAGKKKRGKKKRPGKPEIRFVRAWGGPGTGNGQFNTPTGVAVAPNGDVYAADFVNDRVQVFDAGGNYLDQWAVDRPADVDVSADREVFVAVNRISIDHFSAGGTFLGSIGGPGGGNGQFRDLASLAVAANGDLYAGDASKDTIQQFGPAGAFVRGWGGFGNLDGQLDNPFGIAIAPSGDVYVADSTNSRIQRFSAAGEFLGKWGSQGAGNGQFQNPRGIAVAPNGDVFVADDLNDRIQVFGKTGKFLAQFGSAGSGDGQFTGPFDVALGPNGQIYVSDQNNRIQQFELVKRKKKRKRKNKK